MEIKTCIKTYGIDDFLSKNKEEIVNIFKTRPSKEEAFHVRRLFILFNSEHNLKFTETNLFGKYEVNEGHRCRVFSGIYPMTYFELFVYMMTYCVEILSNYMTPLGCYNYVDRWFLEHNSNLVSAKFKLFMEKLSENVRKD